MTNTVTRLAALGFVLLATALTPLAKATEADKKTVITTNEPIQCRGNVLAAAQYVIKLLDSNSDRNVVQIYNAYEIKLEMTILAKTAYRLSPTGDTRLTFSEMPSSPGAALTYMVLPRRQLGPRLLCNANSLTPPNILEAGSRIPTRLFSVWGEPNDKKKTYFAPQQAD